MIGRWFKTLVWRAEMLAALDDMGLEAADVLEAPMLKARIVRFIRKTLGPEDWTRHTILKPVPGGDWLPSWIVARHYTLAELLAALDDMGGPAVMAPVRDSWLVVVATHCVYVVLYLASALIFGVAWLFTRVVKSNPSKHFHIYKDGDK